MSGTRAGGLKAKIANYERHGADFYQRIGKKGGKNGHSGGFASMVVGADGLTGPERAKMFEYKNGHVTKRGKAKAKEQDMPIEEAEKNRLMVAVALENWRRQSKHKEGEKNETTQ